MLEKILSSPFTLFLYSFTLIAGVLIALLADKKNKTILVVLLAILISIIPGLRSPTVGTDTESYYKIILNNGFWESIDEYGFSYFIYFLMRIFNNVHIVLFVVAFFINLGIILILWRFRNISSFSFSMFLYITSAYFLTFSGIRQWMAVSIIMFSYIFLFKKRYIIFVLLVLIATTFHYTSLLVLFLLPLYLLCNQLTRKKKNVVLISFTITLILGCLVYVIPTLLDEYSHFIDEKYLKNGSGNMIFILIVLFIIIKAFSLEKIKGNANTSNNIETIVLFTSLFFIAHIFFTLVGYQIRNVARIEWYFMPLYFIYFSFLWKNKKKNIGYNFYKIIILFIFLYEFLFVFMNNGNKLVPYDFYWW